MSRKPVSDDRVSVGRHATLRVIKAVDFGVYLDGGELGDILLPTRYIPAGTRVGDPIRVFLYRDSDDKLIATTLKPRAEVGECACLKVVAVNAVGAFLDWGLPKDLLVPFSEQRPRMQAGRNYCVYLYTDDHSNRIVASARLSRFLSETNEQMFTEGQPVDLLLCGRTDLGMKAVINGSHLGMVLTNDLIGGVRTGDRLKGFVKHIRDDGRINLRLQATGAPGRDQLDTRILAFLEQNDGVSTVTDRSSPEAIFKAFGVSKASYKKALGRLYKARLITLDNDRVTLA